MAEGGGACWPHGTEELRARIRAVADPVIMAGGDCVAVRLQVLEKLGVGIGGGGAGPGDEPVCAYCGAFGGGGHGGFCPGPEVSPRIRGRVVHDDLGAGFRGIHGGGGSASCGAR